MQIIPTDGALGAEIRGVDATKPLVPADVEKLKAAVVEHLVLVFRGQSLTEEEQVRFSRCFGDPVPHVRPQAERSVPEIFVISNVSENGEPIGALGSGELTFHSDLSYLPLPGSFSIVHAVEVPGEGGDTQWTNAYAAYDALLDDLLRYVTRPEFVWTHKWRPGDLVVWDNRCTMHRREPFNPAERRILKRTQMFSDAPFLEL